MQRIKHGSLEVEPCDRRIELRYGCAYLQDVETIKD